MFNHMFLKYDHMFYPCHLMPWQYWIPDVFLSCLTYCGIIHLVNWELEDVLVHEMPSILSLMWILHHTLLYTLPVCINQLELYAIKLRWSQGNQLVSNWMNIYFKYLITIITLIFVPIDIPIILFIELSVYSKWNKNSGYQKFILFWISDDRTHIQYLTSSQATIDHCSRIPIDPLLSLCIFHG